MRIDHERVEAVAAELRLMPPEPERRLAALFATWPAITTDELLAICAAVARSPEATRAERALAGMYRGGRT